MGRLATARARTFAPARAGAKTANLQRKHSSPGVFPSNQPDLGADSLTEGPAPGIATQMVHAAKFGHSLAKTVSPDALQRQSQNEDELKTKPETTLQRQTDEEDKDIQTRLDPNALQRQNQNEDELKTKPEATLQRQTGEEDKDIQTRLDPNALQRQADEDDKELQRQPQDEEELQRQLEEDDDLKEKAIQPKLTIGEPGDKYEQEADQMAAKVMRMPDLVEKQGSTEAGEQVVQRETENEDELKQRPLVQWEMTSAEEDDETAQAKPLLQRQPMADEEDDKVMRKPLQREAMPKKDEDETLQAKPEIQAKGEAPAVPNNFDSQLAQHQGSGQPLSDETRAFMEPRFGADFSNVRVHETPDLASAIQAQAFTHGQDIYFNSGKYNPGSSGGKELLAHELTHVVQQHRGNNQEKTKTADLSLQAPTKYVGSDLTALPSRQMPLTSSSSSAFIACKKESGTHYAGWAGIADVRAAEAGKEAGGVSPIKIDRGYANQQANHKEKQMDYFRRADIPFVSNNQEHYAYKKLVELRQEYINDISRITLAEGAFNSFVVPGTLAMKSNAQFKGIQVELGYFDDVDPAEELSKRENKVLSKKLDEEKLKNINSEISSREKLVRGTRKIILGQSHIVQAAMQKRAAILAGEKKNKAEEEKGAIDKKIKAVKDGAGAVNKVIETMSFVGVGGPAAVGKVMKGGMGSLEGGFALGGKGTSMIGATVEHIMTEIYKEQIEKARQSIEIAKTAEAHAKKMDANLSYRGSMDILNGYLENLSGYLEQLSLHLRARDKYFAELAKTTEDKLGQKAGGRISQFLAYVSQANETKSHTETAKDAAESAEKVIGQNISDMLKHRQYAYVANAAGVWDDRARKIDGEGPDLKKIRLAQQTLRRFIEDADNQLLVIDKVIGSLPEPT